MTLRAKACTFLSQNHLQTIILLVLAIPYFERLGIFWRAFTRIFLVTIYLDVVLGDILKMFASDIVAKKKVMIQLDQSLPINNDFTLSL